MELDNKQYVNNAALLKEIYISREKGELTSEAIRLFLIMIEKLSAIKTYPYPEEKEDCMQSAMLDVLLYWKSFDPTKSDKPNPFAYFTTLITNGIVKGWNKLHPKSRTGEQYMSIRIDHNIYSI